jgi:hypothetical protein
VTVTDTVTLGNLPLLTQANVRLAIAANSAWLAVFQEDVLYRVALPD